MIRTVKIKPLSVNAAWMGRRRKTVKYRDYEKALRLLIKKHDMPKGRMIAFYEFGFSSKASDWDNAIKQFQDILSKKNNFNDNRIYLGIVSKKIVPKGQEHIKYEFSEFTEDKLGKIKEIIKKA